MANLSPVSPFAFVQPGHFGAAGAGLTMRETSNVSLVSITAFNGEISNLTEALENLCGATLPAPNRFITIGALTLISSGPGQWMAFSAAPNLLERLKPLRSHAALTDQSHGRAIICISGPKLRETLRKGATLDLHAFAAGQAAVTVISHISALIWREADQDFIIAIPRSFAGSFWHWLETSAAEFGLQVESGKQVEPAKQTEA